MHRYPDTGLEQLKHTTPKLTFPGSLCPLLKLSKLLSTSSLEDSERRAGGVDTPNFSLSLTVPLA